MAHQNDRISRRLYADPWVKFDVDEALVHFNQLQQKLDTFVDNCGEKKELTCLDGTIPINYRNFEYNIPIRIWLIETHPKDQPLCFVTPTAEMDIKVSRYVNQSGEVNIPYLQSWKPNSSDLTGLIRAMISAFEEISPVFMRPRREKVFKYYCNPDLTKKDVKQVLKIHKELKLKSGSFIFNDGKKKNLLHLDGTIGIKYKVKFYNIPVRIWLMENHPRTAPLCFVCPTNEMVIKVSSQVDQSGRLHLPYLFDWVWEENKPDLIELIQVMVKSFEECPPLFTKCRTQQLAIDSRTHNYTSSTEGNTDSSQNRVSSAEGTSCLSQRPTRQPLNTGRNAEPSKLKVDHQTEPSNNHCEICIQNNISAIFLPCGHAHYCFDCATKIFERKNECCVCRNKIERIQKLYLP